MPVHVLQLLYRCFYKVLPLTKRQLTYIRMRADQIPDPELRRQALASIAKKQFHADGGAVFAAFDACPNEHLVNAIVAFQTISDYLDNLCDRSTSMSANDFIRLHEAMIDAVAPVREIRSGSYYYAYRKEQDDGGYLAELAQITRRSLEQLPSYRQVSELVEFLTRLYCNLQVHKHVAVSERVPRLTHWFDEICSDPKAARLLGFDLRSTGIHWWEFAAACGSTLGIFALWTEAMQSDLPGTDRQQVGRLYFPWITGLHILLDYWIDQEEDRLAGDLNFFSYYDSTDHAYERLNAFMENARECAGCLPAPFHRLVVEGLVGMYLSDQKVSSQPGHERVEQLIAQSGWVTKLLWQASHYYRKRTRHA